MSIQAQLLEIDEPRGDFRNEGGILVGYNQLVSRLADGFAFFFYLGIGFCINFPFFLVGLAESGQGRLDVLRLLAAEFVIILA